MQEFGFFVSLEEGHFFFVLQNYSMTCHFGERIDGQTVGCYFVQIALI
jgi:hypothetical protein